jgi:hypothetical protein
MKTTLTLIPQTECKFTNALREHEAAHAVWMATPMHTEAGHKAAAVKNDARTRYEAAYREKYPTAILL